MKGHYETKMQTKTESKEKRLHITTVNLQVVTSFQRDAVVWEYLDQGRERKECIQSQCHRNCQVQNDRQLVLINLHQMKHRDEYSVSTHTEVVPKTTLRTIASCQEKTKDILKDR